MKVPFGVITAFEAIAAISGELHMFQPDDEVSCALGQYGEIITIEADQFLYLVKRSTFDTCCISNSLGPENLPFYPDL